MAATRSRPLDRDGLHPVFDEPFDGPALAPDRWLLVYLPHWSSRERTAARYDLTEEGLRLRIDADTPEWSTE